MSWLAGAVLTGGASRRMGRDKATLVVDGRPMAATVATALRDAGCEPVVAVGGDPVTLGEIGLDVIADARVGMGPAGGLVGALRHFATVAGVTHVAVLACDLPQVTGAALAPLVAAAREHPAGGVVVATTGEGLQPAAAIWSLAAADHLEALVAAGTRALHALVAEIDATFVAVDEAALLNVNRPLDVPARAARRRRYPGDS